MFFFGNQHLRVTSIEHQNDFCVTQLRMSIWTQKQEMFKKQQAQCSQKPFVSWHVSSHSQFVSGSQTQIRCVRSLPRKLEERLSSAKELTAIFLKVVGPAVSQGKILTATELQCTEGNVDKGEISCSLFFRLCKMSF